jgi:nicotinate-nucleotide adenylyltransferase
MRKRINCDCICLSGQALYDKSMKEPAPQVTQCRGRRVAFFGGSFDPPHLGHLAVARAARDALRLDRVLFAPVGAQPLKPKGSTAPFADRYAMTELAIASEPGFEISLADAPTAGRPNYTLDTLRQLRAGLSAGGCLFCLMGADSFASLRRWHGAAEIPFAASLVVASRPGQNLDDLACCLPEGLALEPAATPPSDKPAAGLRSFLIRNPAGMSADFYVLPDLDVEISASDIRSQIRSSSRQAAASQSLPAAVADYIRTHHLYRAGSPAT